MEPVINEMVDSFEKGRVSRRQLVEGLAALMLAAGGTAATKSAQAQGADVEPLPANGIDHISVLVEDLDTSADWYNRVFGLHPVSKDEENRILRLGAAGSQRILVSLREEPETGTGIIDHYCLAIKDFDQEKATAHLKRHGLEPEFHVDYGFFVRDPDDTIVQMFG